MLELANTNAEQAVIGSIFMDSSSYPIVDEIIHGEDSFYMYRHKLIYRAIAQSFAQSQQTDYQAVADILLRTGKLEDCGGHTYLFDLYQNGVPASAVAIHAKSVQDFAIRRAVVTIGADFSGLAHSNIGLEELVDKAQKRVYDLSIRRNGKPVRMIGDCAVDYLYQIGQNEMAGTRTGYHDLDRWTGGLRGGNVYIIAADTGVGKTTFAMNIAENMATADNPAVIFSLEMNEDELFHRIACGHARINGAKVAAGELTDEESGKLIEAVNKIRALPIIVVDDEDLSPMRMRSKIRKMQNRPGLIVVDYIQLLNPGTKWENETTRISHASAAMKKMAKEFDVPVIVVSQLSRSLDHRGKKKRPGLASLRGSGSLEQDAYAVMFLYREEGVDKQTDLIIAKNRGGKTGKLSLLFFGEYSRYENTSRQEDKLCIASKSL